LKPPEFVIWCIESTATWAACLLPIWYQTWLAGKS
jgi:hypothetical protein